MKQPEENKICPCCNRPMPPERNAYGVWQKKVKPHFQGEAITWHLRLARGIGLNVSTSTGEDEWSIYFGGNLQARIDARDEEDAKRHALELVRHELRWASDRCAKALGELRPNGREADQPASD